MKQFFVFFLLVFFFFGCQCDAKKDKNTYSKGGIVRTDKSKKQLTLLFTCADMADGADSILHVLDKHGIRSAFFVTGNFIKKYPDIVSRIIKHKHYLGSHSYSHPLYSTWDNPDSTIISKDDFQKDIMMSYELLALYGITIKNSPFFMPPYEHYNKTISLWASELGLQIVNFTAGSTSNADYTTPNMKNYRSSEMIYNNILSLEEKEGLNGHLMLFHFGTAEARKDKFYNIYLERLIVELKNRGYRFVSLNKAI